MHFKPAWVRHDNEASHPSTTPRTQDTVMAKPFPTDDPFLKGYYAPLHMECEARACSPAHRVAPLERKRAPPVPSAPGAGSSEFDSRVRRRPTRGRKCQDPDCARHRPAPRQTRARSRSDSSCTAGGIENLLTATAMTPSKSSCLIRGSCAFLSQKRRSEGI